MGQERPLRGRIVQVRALGLTMQMVECYADRSLDAALDHASFPQAIAFQTEDFAEGRSAFFEKRAPKFKGT